VHHCDGDTPSSTVVDIDIAGLLAQVWNPQFPTADQLEEAAALVPTIRQFAGVDGQLTEGPRPFLRIGPGVVELRTRDYARAQRTAERAQHQHQVDVELLAQYVEEHGEFPDDPTPTRVITEWSRKSRANMVRTIGLLDLAVMYEDRTRLPGMVTLTYPGCWLKVAPSGKAVKAHLKALRKRYQRAYGEPLRCIWKLEFQARAQRCDCDVCDERDDGRAPHVHMLIVPPRELVDGENFREWLSRNWAEVVDHPDQEHRASHQRAGTRVDIAKGLDARDPKRVSVYFTKHGTYSAKEYQHQVPAAWSESAETGPGRFWGYWALERTKVVVELPQRAAVVMGRVMRRWAAAQQVTRRVRRTRTAGGRVLSRYPEVQGLAGAQLVLEYETARESTRYTRTRAKRMSSGRGFVMVNDGGRFVEQLARYLDQVDQDVLFP
jgi:hypothetical protein